MHDRTVYFIFCLIGTIIAFNVSSISALVPSIARDLACPQFVAGRIVWAYMLPYGLCALFYGPLSRAVSVKNILIVCLSLFSLFSFLSGAAQTLHALFIYRLIVGVFAAAMTPLALLYIAHRFDSHKRGKAVGAFFSVTFLSSLTGLFLSGIVHWRYIFIIPAVVSAGAALVVFYLFPKATLAAEGVKSRYVDALKNQKIARVFLYIFSVSFLYHLARQWMGVYFDVTYYLSQFAISSLLTLDSFAGIFGELFGGMFADKKGRVLTVMAGGLLMGAALLLLPLSGAVAFLAVVMFLWGLGWTVNHSGFSTYLTDLPRPFLQEVASLNSSVRFLAGGLGAAAGGLLMQKSFTATFLIVGAFLLVISFSSRQILRT